MSQARAHSPIQEADSLRREQVVAGKHELVEGEKRAACRRLASLRYCLLLDSERLWAKAFFRDSDDAWFEQELSSEGRLDVVCGDARLAVSLDDLYEDTGLLVG